MGERFCQLWTVGLLAALNFRVRRENLKPAPLDERRNRRLLPFHSQT